MFQSTAYMNNSTEDNNTGGGTGNSDLEVQETWKLDVLYKRVFSYSVLEHCELFS